MNDAAMPARFVLPCALVLLQLAALAAVDRAAHHRVSAAPPQAPSLGTPAPPARGDSRGRGAESPVAPAGGRPPAPPGQPATGPGGADYPFGGVVRRSYGEGDRQFWIYEPTDPDPGQAPVVIFLHGWGAMVPDPYEAWLRHITRRGHIVIYPRYQASLLTPPARMTGHAMQAVADALRELQRGPHVRPDLRRVAVVGHSLGGVLAANLAALAAGSGLPVPAAVMVVQPGDPPLTRLDIARGQPSVMADYGEIPPPTLLLVVVGDRDGTVGDATARLIFHGAWRLPPDHKGFVRIRSDERGYPPLVADHYAPTALVAEGPHFRPAGSRRLSGRELVPPGDSPASVWLQRAALRLFGLVTRQPDAVQRLKPPDALDYFGFWKLFDGLTDAAFYRRHRRYALGNTPEQRFMGRWSDGVPVQEAEVTDSP